MDKKNFKLGVVVDVNDEYDGDRVRVHIRGIDPVNFNVEDIPYAFPMLPKMIHIKPKIGEYVYCITQDGSYNDTRQYIGPIISQPHKIEYDTITALSFLDAGITTPDVAPSTKPDNIGVQPGRDDIAILGRGNTDVILKPSEVRIRAGKTNDMITLNKENPSYIQVKHDKTNNSGSVNIVADNINLLSHKSADMFNLVDSESLITKEEYQKILEKAHQLPYGDLLIDILKIIIKAITTHVHAYNGLAPDLNQAELKKLLEYNLEQILSKNVRIN